MLLPSQVRHVSNYVCEPSFGCFTDASRCLQESTRAQKRREKAAQQQVRRVSRVHSILQHTVILFASDVAYPAQTVLMLSVLQAEREQRIAAEQAEMGDSERQVSPACSAPPACSRAALDHICT